MGWTDRTLLGVALVTLCAACADSPAVSDEAGGVVAAWELGSDVGTVLGPFPLPAEAQGGPLNSWFSAVLPSGDPVEAFDAVVADAEDHGFDARAAASGACRSTWTRDEVPFDVESGSDDGLGFGGDVAIGEALPQGAEMQGVHCSAVISRDDDEVLVTVVAPMSSPAAFPSRTAVLLTSAVDDPPAAAFEPVPVDVDLERRNNGPVTDNESRVLGVGTDDAADLDVIDVTLPGILQCRAAAIRSDLPAGDAALEAFERAVSTYPGDLVPDPDSETTTIGGRTAASVSAIVPAGGPIVYAMATEIDTGSDQLFCQVAN